MLTRLQLDNRRAEMMHSLYEHSGRTCGTYTGLWQEFCTDLARNFRDTDYQELLDSCTAAINATNSHLPEHHAVACIATCRALLLGPKWASESPIHEPSTVQLNSEEPNLVP